jgi:mRNA interferase MazF
MRIVLKDDFPWRNDFSIQLMYILCISFDPQTGHELKGRRTALIVSNTLFNQKTGLAFACPTTTKDKGYPFHLNIPDGLPVRGFVMVDQGKSLDCLSRKADFIAQAPRDLVDEVLAIMDAILND